MLLISTLAYILQGAAQKIITCLKFDDTKKFPNHTHTQTIEELIKNITKPQKLQLYPVSDTCLRVLCTVARSICSAVSDTARVFSTVRGPQVPDQHQHESVCPLYIFYSTALTHSSAFPFKKMPSEILSIEQLQT